MQWILILSLVVGAFAENHNPSERLDVVSRPVIANSKKNSSNGFLDIEKLASALNSNQTDLKVQATLKDENSEHSITKQLSIEDSKLLAKLLLDINGYLKTTLNTCKKEKPPANAADWFRQYVEKWDALWLSRSYQENEKSIYLEVSHLELQKFLGGFSALYNSAQFYRPDNIVYSGRELLEAEREIIYLLGGEDIANREHLTERPLEPVLAGYRRSETLCEKEASFENIQDTTPPIVDVPNIRFKNLVTGKESKILEIKAGNPFALIVPAFDPESGILPTSKLSINSYIGGVALSVTSNEYDEKQKAYVVKFQTHPKHRGGGLDFINVSGIQNSKGLSASLPNELPLYVVLTPVNPDLEPPVLDSSKIEIRSEGKVLEKMPFKVRKGQIITIDIPFSDADSGLSEGGTYLSLNYSQSAFFAEKKNTTDLQKGIKHLELEVMQTPPENTELSLRGQIADQAGNFLPVEIKWNFLLESTEASKDSKKVSQSPPAEYDDIDLDPKSFRSEGTPKWIKPGLARVTDANSFNFSFGVRGNSSNLPPKMFVSFTVAGQEYANFQAEGKWDPVQKRYLFSVSKANISTYGNFRLTGYAVNSAPSTRPFGEISALGIQVRKWP